MKKVIALLFYQVPFFSEEWKNSYGLILSDEHLERIGRNIYNYFSQNYKEQLPYFNEEIKPDLSESFDFFKEVYTSSQNEIINQNFVSQLEKIPFQHWLLVLGQRLTSASIQTEEAIPPLKQDLLLNCQMPYNSEISVALRAWEKHIGRSDDAFWGEIKGSPAVKEEKMLGIINDILSHYTWWNVFFHYKHELVFEVREPMGHGIRWRKNDLQLIGFLEPFMNEG